VSKTLKAAGLRTYAFGTRAKLATQQVFGLTEDETWDDALKEIVIPRLGMTPRELFQRFCTDICRDEVDTSVWVRTLAHDLIALAESDTDWAAVPGIVLTDVRLDNEDDFVRALGGEIWHIVADEPRTQVNESAGARRQTDRTHVTEMGRPMISGDPVINNGRGVTLQALHSQVKATLKRAPADVTHDADGHEVVDTASYSPLPAM
jgi:hypothetical protein